MKGPLARSRNSGGVTLKHVRVTRNRIIDPNNSSIHYISVSWRFSWNIKSRRANYTKQTQRWAVSPPKRRTQSGLSGPKSAQRLMSCGQVRKHWPTADSIPHAFSHITSHLVPAVTQVVGELAVDQDLPPWTQDHSRTSPSVRKYGAASMRDIGGDVSWLEWRSGELLSELQAFTQHDAIDNVTARLSIGYTQGSALQTHSLTCMTWPGRHHHPSVGNLGGLTHGCPAPTVLFSLHERGHGHHVSHWLHSRGPRGHGQVHVLPGSVPVWEIKISSRRGRCTLSRRLTIIKKETRRKAKCVLDFIFSLFRALIVMIFCVV